MPAGFFIFPTSHSAQKTLDSRCIFKEMKVVSSFIKSLFSNWILSTARSESCSETVFYVAAQRPL